MQRSEFIQTTCTGCFGAVAGVSLLSLLLEGCAPSALIYHATGNENIITVPLAELAGKGYLIIRNTNLDNDILLVKDSETQYHSLLMQCTHQDQPLILSSTQLICNTHGSRFDLKGNVLADPATAPLHNFKTQIQDANILITIKA